MLLVVNLCQYNMMQKKIEKMTEIMARWYSSESAQQELSNEYLHDRVWMFLKESLHSWALDESSLGIRRDKLVRDLPMVEYSLVKLTGLPREKRRLKYFIK